MPRVEALERQAAASARPPMSRNQRNRKPAPPQDRLTQRALLFRRIKRSLRPGLWIFGVGAVLVVGAELVRSLPSSSHVSQPALATATTSPEISTAPMHPGLLANALASIGFRITDIKVNGAATTDAAALADAIGVRDGEPTFGFSLSGIQQRVQALGPVQSVTVERILPGTLAVNVTERDVYAIWQTIKNGHVAFELIDKNGNVIADQDAAAAKRREPSLLLLSGADAPEQASIFLPELKSESQVLSHVVAAERIDGLRWNLILKNRTVVKLPTENELGALAQLASLQNSMQLLDRSVESIDLRQEGRLVVRPYVTAAPNLKKKPGIQQEGQ
ncbi:MAG: FtsQ-type POTRA domain-containing protein [Rhodospirillales bacterium]|nr:FtsQ-type POTRA domain-containing protein [Rhodospirillales bacterium]